MEFSYDGIQIDLTIPYCGDFLKGFELAGKLMGKKEGEKIFFKDEGKWMSLPMTRARVSRSFVIEQGYIFHKFSEKKNHFENLKIFFRTLKGRAEIISTKDFYPKITIDNPRIYLEK